MNGSLPPVPLSEVLELLGVDEVAAQEALAAHPELEGAELAWPIRILMGVGAWMAGWFFLAFFGCFGLLNTEDARLVIGLLALGGATALRRIPQLAASTFAHQLSLGWLVAGQALTLSVVGQWTEDPEAVLLASVVQSLVVLAIFPDTVARWVSTVVAVGGTAAWLGLQEVPYIVDGTLLLLAPTVAAVWWAAPAFRSGPLGPLHMPVAHGLVTSLFLVLLTSVVPWSGYAPGVVGGAALTVTFVGTVAALLRQHGVSWGSAEGLVALGGAAALVGISGLAPGVAASGLVLLLAIERRAPLLFAEAVLFLVVFGISFYYWLAMGFFLKSAVLMGTGVLLLVLRAVGQRLVPTPTEAA